MLSVLRRSHKISGVRFLHQKAHLPVLSQLNAGQHSSDNNFGVFQAVGIFASFMLATALNNKSECSNAKASYLRRDDVRHHTTTEKGVWVTHKDGVYDVTEFVANHPGGKEKLMMAAGKDLSLLWQQPKFQQHYRSPLAFELLEEMRIGTLHPDDVINFDTSKLEKAPLKYPTNRIYDCVIVGSGVSGLQCATSLKRQHHIPSENILMLEAQDYVGGRVRQVSEFVKGVPIDVGAEFLHGSNTLLTKFAEEYGQPITEIYCWAHGDGGPLEHTVNKGFGLYFVGDKNGGKRRLLRFDDPDKDFVAMNQALWHLGEMHERDISDMHSLHDYLAAQGFSEEMMDMAAGGFANTLCTNSKDLSLKQCVKWCRIWHAEEGDDGDFSFVHSFKVLVDKLQEDVQIELSSPVVHVQYPQSEQDVMAGLVKLTTKDDVTYYAKSVVLTASPHVLRSPEVIKFSPPLTHELRQALQSVNMHSIVKVFLKFSEPVWPAHLHGMIMTDDSFLLPEIWFRDVSQSAAADEPAKAYCVGFTTAEYAARVSAMPKEEVLRRAVQQLDEVFALLEQRHMQGDISTSTNNSHQHNHHHHHTTDKVQVPTDLKKPSEAYLGGMFWDWNPKHHPYIGGGYCSPKAGQPVHMIEQLALPYGASKQVFFAGEATNMPGATAHAALESGVRAAALVALRLQQ